MQQRFKLRFGWFPPAMCCSVPCFSNNGKMSTLSFTYVTLVKNSLYFLFKFIVRWDVN